MERVAPQKPLQWGSGTPEWQAVGLSLIPSPTLHPRALNPGRTGFQVGVGMGGCGGGLSDQGIFLLF